MFKSKGSKNLKGSANLLLSENSLSELFSGIGGTRIGAEQVGFVVKFAAEIDKACIQTYKDNFGHDSEGDISLLTPKQIPDCTVFAASTPCQSNSQQGNRKGMDDERGDLANKVLDLIERKKPPVVFIENVKGLKSVNGGKDFRKIITRLESIGYWVHYKVLKASDFGVPQKRERLFIVGFLENVPFKFPEQFEIKPKSKNILEAKVHENFFLTQKEIETQINATARYEATGCNHKFRILDSDGSANTILKSASSLLKNLVRIKLEKNAPAGRGIIELPHPKSGALAKYHLRKLTHRECARLQGFPESYKLTSSSAQTYEQLGNSVAVPVIREIFREILVSLTLWKNGIQVSSSVHKKPVNPLPPQKKKQAKQAVSKKFAPSKSVISKARTFGLSVVKNAPDAAPTVYPPTSLTTDEALKSSLQNWHSKDKNNHFMTPVWLTEFLKFVQPIELDAASSPEANAVHKFQRIWTQDDNSLKKSWKVTKGQAVFVNPPYCGTENLKAWATKIAEEFKKHGQPIFALVPARSPESQWFNIFFQKATHIVFFKKRLAHNDLLSKESGKFASALVVFGGDQLGERIEQLSALGELIETSSFRKKQRDFEPKSELTFIKGGAA